MTLKNSWVLASSAIEPAGQVYKAKLLHSRLAIRARELCCSGRGSLTSTDAIVSG